MSKLYFFRHAQASYGAQNYDKLSEHGIQQSKELGKYLVHKNITFDKIFSGPLERQKHTYHLVKNEYAGHKLNIPEAIILDGLKEHEGTEAFKENIPELIRTVPFIKELFDKIETNPKLAKRNSLLAFQYFMDKWAEGKIKVPNALSWEAFRNATKNALQTILEQTGKGETIAIFSSGGTISSIAAEAIQLKNESSIAAMNFSIRNTSFSTFLYSKNNFNLLSLNEIPHLQDEMITFI